MIGHSEAGKTSFIERLLGKEFQEQRQSTEGIHTRFITSFFNKKDFGSKVWTEEVFEASTLEKDFYDSILAQRFIEKSQRKVEHWLQNIPHREPLVFKDSSPQELWDIVDEVNQLPSRDIDHSEKDLHSKDSPEVESKMESKSISEKFFHDDDAISQPTFLKIEFNRPLDSITKINTDNQTEEKTSIGEPNATPIIPQTSSDELSWLLESQKSYAIPSDERIAQPTFPKVQLNPLSDSTTETDSINQNKDRYSVLDPSETPVITKISSDELSRLLESKKSYAKLSDERIPYSVNIWDHGGQNEFIITNQLFLNIEAFNLLVMDISLDLNIPLMQSSDSGGKFGIPKTPAQILCYWLNALHVLAMEKKTEPNIALVLTHQDMIKADDTKQYIDSYTEKLLECISGKQYASYITVSNIYVVDNRQGTERDFAQIRSKIFAQMTNQKSWGIERPTRWLKLEADILQKAKEIDKPYLSISDVQDLTASFAMNGKELKSFLKFHHNLGDLIYYTDKKLSDIVVTNPQWLLDMFKTLITPHEFLDRRQLKPKLLKELKRAILSEESLKVVWEGNDVQFLKDVMMNFDLMLPLGSEQIDKKYLVPCMLPAQELKIGGSDLFTGMALIYSSTLIPQSRDAMPVGAFHKLLSLCSKTVGWTVCADDHLSYNQALIEIDDGVLMEMKLQKSNSIDVSIWSFREKLDDGYLSINEARTLITRAHKATSKCMKIAGLTQKGSFKMLCPHWNPGEEYVCLVTVDEKKEVPQNMPIFYCLIKKCTMHRKELEPGHFPWTKEHFESDGKFRIRRKAKESFSYIKWRVMMWPSSMKIFKN